MSCNRRYRGWRLFFPRHHANAERDCILYRCRANKSAMVLAFHIPAGRDCSRSTQRVDSSVRAALDVAVDIRRPWHSGRRARNLLLFPVSSCSPAASNAEVGSPIDLIASIRGSFAEPQSTTHHSAGVPDGWRSISPGPMRAPSSSSHRLWCSLAQLRSTVPSPIGSNAPSMPMVPM